MGCTNSNKKPEAVVEGQQTSENGFKNLFHANTEFDISATESDDDDEILSVQSLNKNKNNKQNSSKKMIEFPTGLTTTNVNSLATSRTLLDNRLAQTSI